MITILRLYWEYTFSQMHCNHSSNMSLSLSVNARVILKLPCCPNLFYCAFMTYRIPPLPPLMWWLPFIHNLSPCHLMEFSTRYDYRWNFKQLCKGKNCVCICIYVCVYTHIYMCVNICIYIYIFKYQFISVQLLTHVQLFQPHGL